MSNITIWSDDTEIDKYITSVKTLLDTRYVYSQFKKGMTDDEFKTSFFEDVLWDFNDGFTPEECVEKIMEEVHIQLSHC